MFNDLNIHRLPQYNLWLVTVYISATSYLRFKCRDKKYVSQDVFTLSFLSLREMFLKETVPKLCKIFYLNYNLREITAIYVKLKNKT